MIRPVRATAALLEWFEANARALPFRAEPRDPYRVLVSELMLQQTQMDRMLPRYETFVARFPTLEALAAAEEDAVVEAWSGLGYYRRARLLHRLARRVAEAGGELPRDPDALRRLPGVGEYTAAAVASLAFGRAAPVLDGNVLRVAARVLALDDEQASTRTRRVVRGWVRCLMADGAPAGRLNEALMELGATVCTPRTPRCGSCPLAPGCRAHGLGLEEAFPPPRRTRPAEAHEWVAACCVQSANGRWLLRRVDEGPVLRGLWLPPVVEGPAGAAVARARAALPFAARGGQELQPLAHSITFRRIRVVPVLFELRGAREVGEGYRWVSPEEPGLPTSSLLAKLVAAVEAARAQPELFGRGAKEEDDGRGNGPNRRR